MSDRGETVISDLLAEVRITRDAMAAADATRLAAIAAKADQSALTRLSSEVATKAT
jgi:hypothetical protein